MLLHNTCSEHHDSLAEVFSEAPALPRSAERILERVFWRSDDRPEARVLPFRPRCRRSEEA